MQVINKYEITCNPVLLTSIYFQLHQLLYNTFFLVFNELQISVFLIAQEKMEKYDKLWLFSDVTIHIMKTIWS